jgi:hypothetical protein
MEEHRKNAVETPILNLVSLAFNKTQLIQRKPAVPVVDSGFFP